MIDSNNPDIVVVTESWLSPSQADGEMGRRIALVVITPYISVTESQPPRGEGFL